MAPSMKTACLLILTARFVLTNPTTAIVMSVARVSVRLSHLFSGFSVSKDDKWQNSFRFASQHIARM